MKHINKQSKHRQSLYSIEFGNSSDTIRHRGDVIGGDAQDQDGGELSPKPMTPRRVKRRSVMARGSHGRQSSGGRSHHGSRDTLRSKHSSGGGAGADSSGSGSYVRSSTRSSRRKYHQNPVTKLLDQQQLQQQQQQQQYQQPQLGSFHRQEKRSLTASNLQYLNNDIVKNSNNIAAAQLESLGKSNNHYYHSYRKNIPLDPIYYNTNGQGMLLPPNMEEQASPPLPPPPVAPIGGGGHYNASYQHSNTQLNNDDLYNNRPPSVRSSYSNFHGSRPLSTANYNASENVFAGLSGASPPQAPCTPPLYQQHPLHHQQQQQQQQQQYLPPPPLPEPAPVYVSSSQQPSQGQGHMSFSKRTASRESIRSMAFLNNGPPAYNLNYHTPPDSETTM
ncbi:GATA zinc finger domain-containing protein 10 isoform X3 [Drosophila innubila]|uniref:GATA zinc finger domain-containing protein 10 isoform X3 n=1 Tax=Drosophila innubila TaxID=198719 RepID=UPI00148E4B05|nr:GATA zinc finger domain-containing protein 10 isoform X3 [Drosophila innubila]